MLVWVDLVVGRQVVLEVLVLGHHWVLVQLVLVCLVRVHLVLGQRLGRLDEVRVLVVVQVEVLVVLAVEDLEVDREVLVSIGLVLEQLGHQQKLQPDLVEVQEVLVVLVYLAEVLVVLAVQVVDQLVQAVDPEVQVVADLAEVLADQVVVLEPIVKPNQVALHRVYPTLLVALATHPQDF